MSEKLCELRKKGGSSGNSQPLLNIDFDYYTNGGIFPIIDCTNYNSISITHTSGGDNTVLQYPKGTNLKTISSTGTMDCTNYDCLYIHPSGTGASLGNYRFTS